MTLINIEWAAKVIKRDEEKALKAFDPFRLLLGDDQFSEYTLALNYLDRVNVTIDECRKKGLI